MARANINPSRRKFVMSAAAVASVPSVAVPSILPSLPPADWELIELGLELDRRIATAEAAGEAFNVINRRVYEAAEANSGVSPPEGTREDGERFYRAWQVAEKEVGGAAYEEAGALQDQALRSVDELGDVVNRLPAHSIEGLAVKARLAARYCSDLWDRPAVDLDLDQEQARLLIEAVLEAAGLPKPQEVMVLAEGITEEHVAEARRLGLEPMRDLDGVVTGFMRRMPWDGGPPAGIQAK